MYDKKPKEPMTTLKKGAYDHVEEKDHGAEVEKEEELDEELLDGATEHVDHRRGRAVVPVADVVARAAVLVVVVAALALNVVRDATLGRIALVVGRAVLVRRVQDRGREAVEAGLVRRGEGDDDGEGGDRDEHLGGADERGLGDGEHPAGLSRLNDLRRVAHVVVATVVERVVEVEVGIDGEGVEGVDEASVGVPT